ncbi:MAG: orotidine-5'-phosphate decarboxylase [Deltaproteobacteria bacterium]|nr:orotidine-5'-phosphate decarboxylase [Deltaproteobacteria bacterium]
MLQPKDRLIFPLDVPNKAEALKFISLLKDEVGLFKVGLELFMAEGPAFLQFLGDTARVDFFLDLKFHDIPATMAGAQARIMKGAKFVTVHVDQGKKTLKASVEALQDGAKVLGVTVLTHLGPDDLAAMGIAKAYAHPTKLVLLRAGLAKAAGCDGVVCAGTEAQAVKAAFGPDFLVVCPAIRPAWAAVPGDDQRRITTAYDAIKQGADYIVVGRPIRQAADPAEAARRVVQEIAAGLQDRV